MIFKANWRLSEAGVFIPNLAQSGGDKLAVSVGALLITTTLPFPRVNAIPKDRCPLVLTGTLDIGFVGSIVI